MAEFGYLARLGVTLIRMTDSSDIPEFFRWLSQPREVLGVDSETSGFQAEWDRIRYFQFGDLETGWAIEWERWSGVIIEALKKYEGDFVFHNSKFDIRFLEQHSDWKAPWHRIHDTMTMAHLVDPLRPKGLKPLAERLVDPQAADSRKNLEDVMKKNGWSWGTVPVDFIWYWVYAAMDPVLTCHIYRHLKEKSLVTFRRPYDLEMSTTRTVCGMEQRGMKIDQAYCQETDDAYETYARDSRKYISETFGVDNPSSKQLLAFFKENDVYVPPKFTGSGAQSMDKEVMSQIQHPVADMVLKLRKYEKLAGTYFRNLIELSSFDGRVHPNVWTMGTRTARMSVTSPALQTLPKKDTTIRRAFIPDEGMSLFSVDFNQIEARLMAHFANSAVMADAFRGPDDFFCTVAGQIYNEKITKSDVRRSLTKNVIYGKLYGAGVAKMAQSADTPISEMSKFVHIFDESFPDVKRMQKAVERAGTQRLHDEGIAYVITPTGRHLPCEEGAVYRLVNYLIQSHAAEIFKRALVEVDAMVTANYDGEVLLPVHDEIVGQVPTEVAYEATKAVEATMADMTNYLVPITADGAYTSGNWADMVD